MEIIREKTVCFTGHRPEKLPGSGIPSAGETRIIKSMLYNEICTAADDGYDTFITGMQRGIDLWAGEAVLELAVKRDLRLIAALPYRNLGSTFKGQDKWTYGRILDNADNIIIISESYCAGCMNKRNRFMVDNASRLIAVIGSEKSGTGQTLRYAQKHNLDIHSIYLNELFPDPDQLSLL